MGGGSLSEDLPHFDSFILIAISTNRKTCVTSVINSSKLACEVDAKS